MRRILYLALLGMAVAFIGRPPEIRAQTYGYIPSFGDHRIVRMDTTSLTTDAVVLDNCGPYGTAVMPKGTYVLITCRENNRVYRISDANFEGVGSPSYVSVGTEPHGIAIDPTGRYAYVTNFDDGDADDDNLSEISLDTFTVKTSMDLGNAPSAAAPWSVAAHYDEASEEYTAYVANHQGGTISVIRNGSISPSETFAVAGKPIGLALSPDGSRLYAAVDEPESSADGELAVISTSDLTVIRRLGIPSHPWGVAVGSDGGIVYVTQNSDSAPGTVALYYPDDNATIEIDINAANLMGVAAPKNGDFAYVISHATNAVYKIDSDALTTELVIEDEIDGAYALGAFMGGTPPTAPDSLAAEAKSYHEIQLSWTDNAGDELGFKIERRQEGQDSYAQIAKTRADVTEYNDRGLQGSTTYEYRVRAYNEAADSSFAVLSQGVTTEEGRFSWCFIGALLR